MTAIPSALFLDFFEAATEQLKTYAVVGSDDSFHEPSKMSVPLTLDEQRRLLLQIQLECLSQIVSTHNTENEEDVKEDAFKRALSEPALSLDRSAIASRTRMEEAARCAFGRSVLRTELRWDKEIFLHRGNQSVEDHERARGLLDENFSETNSMDRGAMIEFCSLCTAALDMPEVQDYIESGAAISFCRASGEDWAVSEKDWMESPDGSTMPPQRMERLHLLLLRAVGYRADFAKAKMQEHFFPTEGENTREKTDAELEEAISKFLWSMQTTASKASDATQAVTLSDHDSGGFTRVVSVLHSERTIDGSATTTSGTTAVPLAQSMEEHDDHMQQRHLAIAKEAAALQNGILTELMSMSEDDRNELLAEAKDAHFSFLNKISELKSGQDRIECLQDIDAEKQKLLAIHKLWGAVVQRE